MSTYNIAVTAIVMKDHKVLLTKRSDTKKKWPGYWTVPGGNLEDTDFIGTPTEINNQWYHTLENCVRREVREETGLEIRNIRYLCNIAIPGCVIVSYVSDYASGEVVVQEEEVSDYAWVAEDEISNYNLIEGIAEEIRLTYET